MNRREFMAVGAVGLAGCAVPLSGDLTQDDWRIWDQHVHMAGAPGKTPEERMEYIIRVADRMGIEKLICHLGMQTGSNDPSPEDLRRYNDDVLRAVRASKGRALGYVYLNPNHGEASLKLLEEFVAKGPFVGVKLWVARRCREPELDPIIRRAGELKAGIYQHTWFKTGGNLPGESTPVDMAELAARHPGVTLVCGHSGGDWERGIRAIRASKNVLLEIAGYDPTAGAVEMAVRELGAERIVYGSDVCGRSFSSQLSKVLGAQIPDDAKKLILGGNLRRILGSILATKP